YPSGSMTTPEPPPSMLAEKTATTAGRTFATTSTRRASACLAVLMSAAATPASAATTRSPTRNGLRIVSAPCPQYSSYLVPKQSLGTRGGGLLADLGVPEVGLRPQV